MAHVTANVEQWPPLSEVQRETFAALLDRTAKRPAHGGGRPDGAGTTPGATPRLGAPRGVRAKSRTSEVATGQATPRKLAPYGEIGRAHV